MLHPNGHAEYRLGRTVQQSVAATPLSIRLRPSFLSQHQNWWPRLSPAGDQSLWKASRIIMEIEFPLGAINSWSPSGECLALAALVHSELVLPSPRFDESNRIVST